MAKGINETQVKMLLQKALAENNESLQLALTGFQNEIGKAFNDIGLKLMVIFRVFNKLGISEEDLNKEFKDLQKEITEQTNPNTGGGTNESPYDSESTCECETNCEGQKQEEDTGREGEYFRKD